MNERIDVRIIPALLLSGGKLVKTVRFQEPKYVGDPLNAVKIFNEKEADELVLLDIDATRNGSEPQYALLGRIAAEAFMPVCYGGGVRTIEHFDRLYQLGFEKVCVNSAAFDLELVSQAAARFGSQSVVVSIDAKERANGAYTVCTTNGTRDMKIDPVEHARRVESAGAGELLVTSIDRDGMRIGYDLKLIRSVSSAVQVPVIACGGAGEPAHLLEVIADAGASAACAGSLFVFQGKHRAVLISYPESSLLSELMNRR